MYREMAETSADYFGEYLQEYLQTSEAKQIMTNWANEVFGAATFDISDADLQGMAKELAQGYSAYANAYGYPDPAQMGQQFMKYLQTEDGQKRLDAGDVRSHRYGQSAKPAYSCYE